MAGIWRAPGAKPVVAFLEQLEWLDVRPVRVPCGHCGVSRIALGFCTLTTGERFPICGRCLPGAQERCDDDI